MLQNFSSLDEDLNLDLSIWTSAHCLNWLNMVDLLNSIYF